MKLILIGILPILLLIGVGTSVMINTNLINTASKITDDYKSRTEEIYQEEIEFEGISIGNTTYNSVEEYIDSANSNY